MKKQRLSEEKYAHKKWARNLTYLTEVLVYHATIRKAHARVVSILAYHLVAKNYQFSV
uniref:hypothetical protein n=1 Tax=uncultured Christiangramia sp. TaxID=503836 RepID=UPI002616006A|nr:hypothetical protein [uncultured Christiangramia sp.]